MTVIIIKLIIQIMLETLYNLQDFPFLCTFLLQWIKTCAYLSLVISKSFLLKKEVKQILIAMDIDKHHWWAFSVLLASIKNFLI